MDNLAIKNFLDSAEFQNGLKLILAKFKIEAKLAGIKEIFADILNGKISLFDLPSEMISRLQIADVAAYGMSAEMYSFYLEVTPKALLDQPVSAESENTEIKDSKPVEKYDFKKFMRELKVDCGLQDEEVNDSRLEQAVINRLRNIRDYQETLDILIRSPKIGGVGLSEGKANNVLMMLVENQKKLSQQGINIDDLIEGANQVPQKIQESEIDVAAKVIAPKAIQSIESDDVTIDQILQQRAQSTGRPTQMPSAPTPDSALHSLPFVKDIEEEEVLLNSTDELSGPAASIQPLELKPAESQPVAPQSIRPPEIRQPLIRQTAQVSDQPQMSDVKFDPKLYGPLDELAAMSLSDFRRLSKDPQQSIQKINGKLEILEGESMVRKYEGVKALKSSPLYNIYADIMNRALAEGKSFEQVIAERGDINITEFKAIMELNKSLKY